MKIPHRIFKEELNGTEFIVYAYLVSCTDSSKTCFPSRETIAKNCQIKSIRTVDKTLAALEERGLISKLSRFDYSGKGRLSNLYSINDF